MPGLYDYCPPNCRSRNNSNRPSVVNQERSAWRSESHQRQTFDDRRQTRRRRPRSVNRQPTLARLPSLYRSHAYFFPTERSPRNYIGRQLPHDWHACYYSMDRSSRNYISRATAHGSHTYYDPYSPPTERSSKESVSPPPSHSSHPYYYSRERTQRARSPPSNVSQVYHYSTERSQHAHPPPPYTTHPNYSKERSLPPPYSEHADHSTSGSPPPPYTSRADNSPERPSSYTSSASDSTGSSATDSMTDL